MQTFHENAVFFRGLEAFDEIIVSYHGFEPHLFYRFYYLKGGNRFAIEVYLYVQFQDITIGEWAGPFKKLLLLCRFFAKGKLLIALRNSSIVNLPMKIIAALLIISAGISTVYSAHITMQYSAAMNALGEFSAGAEYDFRAIENGTLYVNITFRNPSNIEITTYEIDYAFYIYNSSERHFTRYAVFTAALPIHIGASSEKRITLKLSLSNRENVLWLLQNEEDPTIDQYMEIYYQISNYGYKNVYRWGTPHLSCSTCGGGIFG